MFDQAKADVICEYLAEGQSLRAICRMEGMPAESTVREWVDKDVQGFAAQYAQVRARGYAAFAEDIVEIADAADALTVNAARLQVETRKWLLSKMLPKVYGDKVETVHSGELGIRRIERVITRNPAD